MVLDKYSEIALGLMSTCLVMIIFFLVRLALLISIIFNIVLLDSFLPLLSTKFSGLIKSA